MREEILKILEEIPCGLRNIYLKIAETDYALKQIQQTRPGWTMTDLKEHNAFAKGFDEGFTEAMKKVEEWRNQKYLEYKNLIHE